MKLQIKKLLVLKKGQSTTKKKSQNCVKNCEITQITDKKIISIFFSLDKDYQVNVWISFIMALLNLWGRKYLDVLVTNTGFSSGLRVGQKI